MNIIITGASRGLGKAIAEKFAGQGDDLYLCSRNEEALLKTMEELKMKYPGVKIEGRAFDLAKKEQARQLGKWILDAGIFMDVLVNNAGQFIPGNVSDEQDGVLEKMIGVNLYSAYHLTRALLPGMMEQRKGHIFNICSIASLQAYPNGGSYGISKFALAGFSKNLREEMKPYGIKVTALYPGAAYTDSWASSGVDPHRIMEAEDIAAMVYAATQLSPQATVEDILLRPQLGDL
ncbi:MAG TPA: SDR family oxidoreductase [Puia sp.]|nr:SDR family oxidoreductase [Puia sp.]